MRKGIFTLLATMLLVLAPAFAQSNRVPYTAPRFSASFNGTVSTQSGRNEQNTSTNDYYTSSSNGIGNVVAVRTVDQDIPMTQEALDYYVGQLHGNLLSSKYITENGHQAVIAFVKLTDKDGNEFAMHAEIVLINSRTVIFQIQESAYASDNVSEWNVFNNSLRVQ